MSRARLLCGLLAAGHSRRFGSAEKLLASLDGQALVNHAANALARLGGDGVIAVAAPHIEAALPGGIQCLEPASPEAGLGDNIALLAAHASAHGYGRLLVHLGDMPRVPAQHLQALVELCQSQRPAVTSVAGRLQVPCCFPSDWFPTLMELRGDRGAGSLLAADNCTPLPLGEHQAIDIDTLADLEKLGQAATR